MKILLFGILIGIIFVSGTSQAFGEVSYEILENRFYNQPITCIYEPYVPNARDVIIDAWLKETELGVKFWQYELQVTEFTKKDKWNIETQIISLDDQPYFDNQYCDVEIRFVKLDPEYSAAGWHWFDGTRSQIEIVYTDMEVCRTWTEGNYRYQEWCYKDDLIRSKALGNTVTHEFGHAIGLEHYESDDPYENYQWSIDPYSSPSVMTLAVHYDETKNQIRKVDIDKVKEIYQYWGFGDPKPTTPQEFPTFETKNMGGFESFSLDSSKYYKDSGKIQYVTLHGKVTEASYADRQSAKITIQFPDGQIEEMDSYVLENRQFSLQFRIDNSIPSGDYTLSAKYRNYDSITLTFSVLDETSIPVSPKPTVPSIVESKETVKVPSWIKNNVKWWSEGIIDDSSFVSGIEFLISEGMINVPIKQKDVTSNGEIPIWVRTNAEWWANDQITDSDFVKGIEFLVNSGIIHVK
ncbi:hypothetical protein [Nitrosopumilus sp.]|uniref:hypothetical protein n=1 Tax=Nitrosopumilus sp. TaxID=2024843 RepID=UPI003D0D6C97